MNISKQRVESAIAQAVLDFNVGASAYARLWQKNVGVSPSSLTFLQMHRKDKRRCRKSTVKSSAAYKLYKKSAFSKIKTVQKTKKRSVLPIWCILEILK